MAKCEKILSSLWSSEDHSAKEVSVALWVASVVSSTMIPGYIVRDGMFLRSLLESVVTEPMETAFTIPFLRCNLCATFRFPTLR